MLHKFYDQLRRGEILASSSTPEKWFNLPGSGGTLLSYGTVVPVDGTAGFAASCLFLKTNGGIGTSLYVNEGSATSSDFNAK